MPPYVPLHDRPPYYSSLSTPPRDFRPPSPRYASPDLDPNEPYPWTREGRAMADSATYGEYEEGDGGYYPGESDAGPSRKRAREDEGSTGGQGYSNGGGYQHGRGPPAEILPSIFQIAPRNPFTRTVGEFLMEHCRNKDHIEIEIKLGQLSSVSAKGQPQQRLRLPALSELIVPRDYPISSFHSNMDKEQHRSLNALLNQLTESSGQSSVPIRFRRQHHEDMFYDEGGPGKVRVSRDAKTKELIPGGCVRKRRVADLNIFSPSEAFDWRVSVSTETPCDPPEGRPNMWREKDRASYKHQLVQVDLSVVKSRFAEDGKATVSFELELEVIDAPRLIAEGAKEERGDPNRFDEMVQSCLDSARMLIRNVG